MAFIECKKHGGHVASLVSKQVAAWVKENKEVTVTKIEKIIYIDSNNSRSYFVVDAESFLKLSAACDIDLSNPIESEELAFELSMELDAVCPLCLSNWLKMVNVDRL